MIIQKFLPLLMFFACMCQSLTATSLATHFKQTGYAELCDTQHGTTTYDSLYAYFDEFIEFLQAHPPWAQKLYVAKERFIRTKERDYYSTDFFGLYDESKRVGRHQVAFYYSTHFHDFLRSHYKTINQVPEIINFLQLCREIQKPCVEIFYDAATEFGLETIFDSQDSVPILFKVVKYFPDHHTTRPHYDGTAFSLFLDSTDNQSLLLSAYKTTFAIDDFCSVTRKFPRDHNQNSMLLIPGAYLTEFSIFPTAHIVASYGATRYATIAFAMRRSYSPQKNEFSPLPDFNY